MISLSSAPSTPAALARDWAVPRTAAAYTGTPAGGESGGPGGVVLLCVNNSSIPCKSEGAENQKSIGFTVLNVRQKGWLKAPWKKLTGKAKPARDDTAKELFESHEWARDDVTMERVAKSVLAYTFIKDGQARGERVESVSHIESGQTYRINLQSFMFEEKKGGETSRNVFPPDVETIPPFTVLEMVLSPGHSKQYEEGWGMSLSRVRVCPFTLYSMLNPLGLGLLPSTYEQSLAQMEAHVEVSPGLKRILEGKNTGFFGRAAVGSYLVQFNDDYRLVGPKEDPADPLSRHLDVMPGGVFAIDISKRDLLRFTNASEEEDEDGLVYAQCLVDLAASGGALSCYVCHNEFLLRKDPNRSPFTGVPLVHSNQLLEAVTSFAPVDGKVPTRFPLPFPVVNMESPHLTVTLACIDNNSSGEDASPLPCPDFVFASENACVRNAYPLTLGDAVEDDFMRILFMPRASFAGGAGKSGVARATLERQDYRVLKKQRLLLAAAASPGDA